MPRMTDDGGSRAGVGPPIPHPKLPLYLSLDDSLSRIDLASHSRGQSYSIVAVGVPSGIEIEESSESRPYLFLDRVVVRYNRLRVRPTKVYPRIVPFCQLCEPNHVDGHGLTYPFTPPTEYVEHH